MQHLAQNFALPGAVDLKASTLDAQNFLQTSFGLGQTALEPAHGGHSGFAANWQVRIGWPPAAGLAAVACMLL